jgi:hypothetical protein
MKENTICEECQESGALTGANEACSEECYDALPLHIKKLWEKREREEARHYRDFLFQL